MPKDIAKKIEQEEKKLNKRVEAYLWKAGYAASKSQGMLATEGYEVDWPVVNYHTGEGLEKKMEVLNKYKDAIQEHDIIADIIEIHSGYPRLILGFPGSDDTTSDW